MIEKLYKIQKEDISKAAKALANSFNEYVLYTSIIKDSKKREKFLCEFYSLLSKVALKYGQAYAVTSDIEAVVLYMDEKYQNISLNMIIKSGAVKNMMNMCSIAKISGMKRFFKLSSAINSVHKDYQIENNLYLQILGVVPEMQGKKLASKLINKVLFDCKERYKGCYIETGDPRNVKIYQKFGFTLLENKSNYANNRRIYYLYYTV